MKYPVLAAACALLALSATPANAASLIGADIKATWRLPTETSLFAFAFGPSPIFTVGDGAEGEAQLSSIRFLVDFSADALTMTFLTNATFSSATFNGIYFQQLGADAFGTVQSVSGITANRIHNMGDALSVNFAGQNFSAGDVVTVAFVPDVPEPATWGMMIVGLGLTGGMLRRGRAVARA